jgi:hypothetical protein
MITCDGQLVKRVVLKNRVLKYYPIYYYCYSSLLNSLEKLLEKPEGKISLKNVKNGEKECK